MPTTPAPIVTVDDLTDLARRHVESGLTSGYWKGVEYVVLDGSEGPTIFADAGGRGYSVSGLLDPTSDLYLAHKRTAVLLCGDDRKVRQAYDVAVARAEHAGESAARFLNRPDTVEIIEQTFVEMFGDRPRPGLPALVDAVLDAAWSGEI